MNNDYLKDDFEDTFDEDTKESSQVSINIVEQNILKEIAECTNPISIVKEYWDKSNHVSRFTNVFAFMDRCKVHKVNEENSITYYDEVDRSMYIKHPYINYY